MADEGRIIRSGDAGKFADAAASVDRSAKKIGETVRKVEKAAAAADDTAKAVQRAARRLEQRIRIGTTEAGRFYLEETTGRGAARRTGYVTREGRQRPSFFGTREAAEGERSFIAMERARAAAAEQTAATVERSQDRQTRAVQEGARKRTEAARVEGQVARGNAAEFDRIAGEIDDAVKRNIAAHDEYQRKVKAGQAPAVGSAEFERQAAAQRAAAEAIERQQRATVPLRPVREGPISGVARGRDVLRRIDELEARGEALVAKEQEARETRRLVRAEAREREEHEKAAADTARQRTFGERLTTMREALRRQLGEEIRQSREAPTREPGTALARIPGREYIPAAGFDPTRQIVGRGIEIRGPPAVAAPGSAEFQRQVEINRARSRLERQPIAATAAFEKHRNELRGTREEAMRAATAEGQLAQSVERAGIAADLSSQRFRKHGALTTEFIDAAARGEVTIRELGYQVTATIGKFAGWTAAASAVYGVTAAFAQMAKGAIDAESGVNKVNRVTTQDFDPGRLRESFRGLSEQFNVPIEDSVDAVYGAAKVYRDLDQVLQGAEASLFAMKVGELDATAAQESLTAIVRGFRLEGSELASVFDVINQAQNRFGGNVGQLTQGVGRAAGQFKSAGGEVEELIALLTLGSRVTGAPATEVATAIGRSVSVVRTPAGAARARRAGLDPTLDPLSLLQQAQRLGRGASAERVQELARAIIPAGGQFARIFVPMIENAELLNEILAETSPEKSKGSAQRELAKALSQVNEQMSAMVNGLQQLGAAAADAGLLAPFVLLVKGINLALDGLEKLFDLFNKVVPDPLQPILATALEFYGVLRLLRRFDIGGQIAATDRNAPLRQFLGATPERRERRQVTQGLTAMDRFLADTRERVGKEAALAAHRQEQSARRLFTAIGTGDQELVKRRTSEYQRAALRATDLADEELDLRRQINVAEQQRINFLRGIREGEAPRAAAQAAGIRYMVPGVERPTTRGPEPLGLGREGARRDIAGATGGLTAAAAGTAATAAALTRQERAIERVRTQSARLGTSGRALGAAAAGAVTAANAAGSVLRTAGTRLSGAGAALAAMVGPIDLLIITGLVTWQVADLIARKLEENEAEFQRLASGSPDPEVLRRRAERLRARAEQTSVFETGVPGLVTYLPRRIFGAEDRQQRTARLQEAQARQLEQQQQVGIGLPLDTIQQRLQQELRAATGDRAKAAAIRGAIQQVQRSFQALYDPSSEARAAVDEMRRNLVRKLSALASSDRQITAALKEIKDFEGLAAFVEQQAAKLELTGKPIARRGLAASFQEAAENFLATDDYAAFLKAIKDSEDAVISDAQTRLERALATARTPGDRRAAYRTFERQLRTGLGVEQDETTIDTLELSRRRRRQQIGRLEGRREELIGAGAGDPLLGVTLGGLPTTGAQQEIERIDAQLRRLRQANKDDNALMTALGISLRHRRQAIRDAMREAHEQEQDALRELRVSIQAGRLPAGVPRAAFLVRQAGRDVQRAIRRFGRGSVQVLQAIQAQQQLMAQQVQEQASLITSRAQYVTGGAPGAGLQELLAHQRAHPEVYSEADVFDTLNQIREANEQRAQDAKAKIEEADQKAREMIDARYEFLSSLTDDPVKLARLEIRRIDEQLRRPGLDPAERLRLRADRNRQVRDREQAQRDRRIERLDYLHDVDRLSDEAYVRGLDKVLRGMKKGTEAYRQLKYRIGRFKHDMEQESEDFPELNVGDIRLPSVYDVRRLIRQGTQTNAANVQQSNTYNFTVRSEADVQAIGGHLEHIHGTTVKAGMRAAGLAG
jgi:TP901 family phage tail tape measure protein